MLQTLERIGIEKLNVAGEVASRRETLFAVDELYVIGKTRIDMVISHLSFAIVKAV